MEQEHNGSAAAPTRDTRWDDPPGMGQTMIRGAVIGVVISFIGVTIGILALGADSGSAIGIGLFAAFWGGLGFGSMVGGVVYAFGAENDAEAARVASLQEREHLST